MRKIYKIPLILFFLFSTFSLFAQKNFFSDVSESQAKSTSGTRVIIPQKYRTISLDNNSLQNFLRGLPSEKNVINRKLAPVLQLPMPDGRTASFNVWESSIQEPALEAKFPEIKTFAGQGIDDPYATIRFDYTPRGFHAQVLTVNGTYYLDPLGMSSTTNYISYYRTDLIKSQSWTCDVTDISANAGRPNSTAAACLGTNLRTYRLAVANTGEYAQAPGINAGTDPTLLHAAIVTSVNRVVGVYEKEVAIRMILVANNNLVEFLNASTDPFAGNNNANVLINESQTVIDANIQPANYDIGHTFSTGGGGLAQLNSPCTGNKARGITGSPSPTGDAYDIDYVAHEVGHQFGGNHSMAGCGASPTSTKYEVGSGTTIQAYAGICGAENIQPNSDPYFHAISFDEISNFITSGAGNSCGVSTATSNNLPVIAPLTGGQTIPIGTPFTLTGSATDADGDALTYNWEQWDFSGTATWNAGATAAPNNTVPLFKSRIPKTTGSRTFPDVAVINANYPAAPGATMGGLKGETLSPVARTMKFKLTVRDNRAGGGGVVSAGAGGCQTSTVFDVNVAGTAPFIVTVPNGGESYTGGSTQNITWNVVGTNAAPFSVTNVRILYSTDGGLTYPQTLSASTANDGSEPLVIPIGATTTAKVKVEAIGNIFFDVSNANFTVTVPVNDFAFGASTASTSACPAPTNPTVTIPTTVTGTFTTPITLAATSGVPAGTTVTFAPNSLTPGASTVATLNNANILANGTYNITVTGTAGASVKTTTITFIVTAGAGPILTTVANQTVCAPATATFTVSTVSTPVTYQWQSAPTLGGTYTNITGANGTAYTTGATSGAMNGMGFRCIVSTQCGSTTSNNALLTVNTAAAIATQPTNQPSCTGNTATFTGLASGTGVAYQWQSSTTGVAGTFTDIPGATNASYTTPIITGTTPGFYQFVATTTTCAGTATSNVAQLTINVTASIGTQPTAQTVCAPSAATFTVAATGSGLSYQWQVATAAAPTTFTNVGTNSNSYTTGATTVGMNGNIYRVIVTGSCNAVTSGNATLTVNTAAALTSVAATPTNATVCNGATISFTATASGTGVTYQWQRALAATPTVFVDVIGATSASYTTVPTTPVMNGDVYRVVVTTTACAGTATSTPIAITVNTVAIITTQPSAQTTCVPNSATFTVAAIGTGLSYQWQRALAASPTVFADIAGATSASYTTPATVIADNGNLYRVNILSTCSPTTPTISNTVLLTVNNPVTITQNPVSVSGCAGDNYTFSVTATGTSITYQWQVASAQSPTLFVDIPGAVSSTYTVTNPPLFFSGNLYRVVISAACVGGAPGGITTAPVTLTLSNKPTVVLTAPATSPTNPAVNSTIFATVSPANANIVYTWRRNGVIIPNTLTSTSIVLAVDDNASYQVTITDASTGCQSTSNTIATLARTSDNLLLNKVFIYPNPVRTMMQVRFNNSTSVDRGTMLNIYDSKGTRVFTKAYVVNGTYGRMDVDMSTFQPGTYLVYVMDKAGNKLGGGKVVKLN